MITKNKLQCEYIKYVQGEVMFKGQVRIGSLPKAK